MLTPPMDISEKPHYMKGFLALAQPVHWQSDGLGEEILDTSSILATDQALRPYKQGEVIYQRIREVMESLGYNPDRINEAEQAIIEIYQNAFEEHLRLSIEEAPTAEIYVRKEQIAVSIVNKTDGKNVPSNDIAQIEEERSDLELAMSQEGPEGVRERNRGYMIATAYSDHLLYHLDEFPEKGKLYDFEVFAVFKDGPSLLEKLRN